MTLNIASLNSGSNGNAYYVANEHEAVLVDIGLSCREIETRMKRLNLSVKKVKAVFISHEHSDHIKGVEVFSKKHQTPVYITNKTYKSSGLQIEPSLKKHFTAYESIKIGGLTITSFPKFHDAADPFSFVVSGDGVNVGVFTDIGSICEHVIKNFSDCHAVFLETNYDEEMLQNGTYPFHLKKRISGDHGHLSNKQALRLFLEHRSAFLSHLFLSHLSRDNNSPELVHQLFLQHAGNTEIIVASRYEESKVYCIERRAGPKQMIEVKKPVAKKNVQMKLF